MNYLIQNREPASVFRFFEEICAIPHPSYHEEKIADYLVAFAKQRGLEYYRDQAHNVLIKAPATPGMEERAPILLQGHTDMVCEKNADVEHDFLTDPLKLYLDGNQLRAKGTTLGADDGIAVAMMLALLDGAISSHPALECLFTTAEEVGLDGATTFDYSRLAARRMINLDNEELGVLTAGCAGGMRSDLTFASPKTSAEGATVRLFVGGLMGGHSGVNIDCGRANANKLVGRLLASLQREQEVRLVSLQGGSKDNAIPRECEAVFVVPDADAAIEHLTELAEAMASELSSEDKGFFMTAEQVADEPVAFGAKESENVIALLCGVANGVLAMSNNVKGLVEYSRNQGVIHTEGDTISVIFSSRSSIESLLDSSVTELDTLARVLGASARHYARYPGWSYAKCSALRDAYLEAYRQVMGKDATVNVIHAGLECGVISSKVPDMDMISIGPDMRDIHSPDEALDLDSVELFWKTLEHLIRTV